MGSGREQHAAATPLSPENRTGSSNVHVVVRIRPNPEGETGSTVEVHGSQPALLLRPTSVTSTPLATNRRLYEFDAVLGPDSKQGDVFRCVGQPLVDNCLAGYNSTVMAYGPTGSGKTHTMLGEFPGHSPVTTPRTPTGADRRCRRVYSEVSSSWDGNVSARSTTGSSTHAGSSAATTPRFHDASTGRILLPGRAGRADTLSGWEDSSSARGNTPGVKVDNAPRIGEGGAKLSAAAGLTPRILEYLFSRLEALRAEQPGAVFSVRASFYEIYNETITDLLSRRSNLAIRRQFSGSAGTNTTVRVDGAEEREIADLPTALALVAGGLVNRSVAGTASNEASSRSHAVLSCSVECCKYEAGGLPRLTRATLNLVDLAGSERQCRSGAVGQRLTEAASINKSLSALGHVVTHVVQGSRHVPYRDSKLTHLLQDTLGGNAKAVLIAAVNPCSRSLHDTERTLGFAARAAQMPNTAVVIEGALGDVEKLKAENCRLRSALEEATGEATKLVAEVERLLLSEQPGGGDAVLDKPLGQAGSDLHALQLLEVASCDVQRRAIEDARGTAEPARASSQQPQQLEDAGSFEQHALDMVACDVPLPLGVFPLSAAVEAAAQTPAKGSTEVVAAPQPCLLCVPSPEGGSFRWGRLLRQTLVPASILAAAVLGVAGMAPRALDPAQSASRRRTKISGPGYGTRSGLSATQQRQRSIDECAFGGGEGCAFGVPDPTWRKPEKLGLPIH
eukprot:jgi/Tetstr1/459335/TSEL_004730.t1